jgi:spore maturation protein CgeB
MKIVILGLSITSSWGNGHATTYRGLVRELVRRGHDVLFLERDVPWYACSRDLPDPPYGTTRLYASLDELHEQYVDEVRSADLVIVGSYVPDGVRVGDWVQAEAEGVKAFYDIDTPVTLAKMARGDFEYLHPRQIPGYDLYLSFTGGPTLKRLEREFGSPRARALYCSFDPELYYPEPTEMQWDLGYMGTYSDDRQPSVKAFLLQPAREYPQGRFIVAGPQYPETDSWPGNVTHQPHLPPAEHRRFYNSQRFTLNVTRKDLIAAGWSPSVRLFEAAACATPIISDNWPGLGTFFKIGEEILTAKTAGEVLQYLRDIPEHERRALGERARARVMREHTAAHRAEELEGYALRLLASRAAA